VVGSIKTTLAPSWASRGSGGADREPVAPFGDHDAGERQVVGSRVLRHRGFLPESL